MGVANVGDAESGSGGHYETQQRGEVGKLFEKEEDTKEYNEHLQTCMAEVQKKNVYKDLAWLKPHPYIVNKVFMLPVDLSSFTT